MSSTFTAYSGTCEMCDKAAKAAHVLYRGVLYFRNVRQFHGTRVSVILNSDMQKTGLRRAGFDETNKRLTTVCADVLY